MGNAIAGGRRRTARVMMVDGTTYKYRPPASAAAALRDHPGYQLLESEEVKRLGMRARPLDADAPLKPGKLYFLVELPRLAGDDDPRAPPVSSSVEAGEDGAVRLRMRLPKAEVARLVKESRDAAEAAEKIMQLCVARDHRSAPATPVLHRPLPAALVSSENKKVADKKQKKKARFMTDVPDEIIGF
uniref:Uncharacterized protein n=1 Tax=Oryza punctata TaxID=4537 RepID=A0A0E0LV21_ORYPU